MVLTAPSPQPLPGKSISRRNALIAKIARLLNYISKEDYQKLMILAKQDTGPGGRTPDILKLILDHGLITASDHFSLKKACVAFATIHSDNRFGALCLEFNFLTEGNLTLALEEQQALADRGQHIQLGDLLVDAGMISPSQQQFILKKQQLNESAAAKPEEFSPGNAHMREIREHCLIYYIRKDGLKAYVLKRPAFDPDTVTLEFLKESLLNNGIIYGLPDDGKLITFLESDRHKTRLFEVASGLPPVDGIDARIEYRFEQAYLKAGQFRDDGSIDFKERGEIPFVRTGDVLAEKIPLTEGKEGVNIFGDTVPFVPACDRSIQCGNNVRLSPDECRALSDVEGNPKIDSNGILSVHSACLIEGDVDYSTGHVKFDKNVYITGIIKSGFRVEAIDVVADAVDGGVINARGDILIKNGITEAEIISKGSITATYIHRSRISCLRDLKVTREVVDTEARMDGRCLINTGRLSSSTLAAKGGAVIKDIGSRKATPTMVAVGTSLYTEEELARADRLIEKQQNLFESFTLEKTRIETELGLINKTLENLMNSRKETQAAVHELKQQKKLLDITPFQDSLVLATEQIETLNIKKGVLTKQQIRAAKEVQRASERVNASVQEKFRIKRLEQNTPSRAVLDVGGTIFSGSRIHGKHSQTILKETLHRVRIMEISRTDDYNAEKSWEMVITPL